MAGTILHFHLWQRGKKVLVIDNSLEKNSSIVAAGMYNPIVFKRVTKSWNADKLSPYSISFYKTLEQHLDLTLNSEINILRFFKTIEQQNDFFIRAEDPSFSPYLISNSKASIEKKLINNEFGFGEITKTGWVNTLKLISGYQDFLSKNNLLLSEKFNYEDLVFTDKKISYKGITADKVIFCEGTLIQQNPYFNYLPLVPTKGEVLTIHAPKLKTSSILNKGFFILPLGEGKFRIGATYNWKELNYETTPKGKKEILDKLDELINCEYKVLDHKAGIRPTVKDRKPLIGLHPEFASLAVFNGMGTKGILIAPYYANQFSDFLAETSLLDTEVNINRFQKK